MSGSREQWSDNELVELKRIFYSQAYEIVEDLQEAMLRLEAEPADGEVLKTVKRSIHTLKGDAHSVGLQGVGTLCHRMEDVLAQFLNSNGSGSREAFELLLVGVDAVHLLLSESEAGKTTDDGEVMLRRIDLFLGRSRRTEGPGTTSPAPAALSEYQELQVRDALGKGLHVYDLEALFHPGCGERSVAVLMLIRRLESHGTIISCRPSPESGEIARSDRVSVLFSTELGREAVEGQSQVAGITERITVLERAAPAAPAPVVHDQAGPGTNAKSELLRIDAAKVDLVMDLVGEIIIGRSMIDQITRDLGGGSSAADIEARLQSANAYMERAVSDIQKGVMKMRMVTVHTVFRKFPRMVRDLALEKGKRVRVDLLGSETELDKRIVDALGEPLAHIIRNAVDHGIEDPAERRAAGKPEEAAIRLKAYHEASRIVIEIADDGRGIDREALKRKAVAEGRLTGEEAENLTDNDALSLIFLSGLSTASSVSETSGRGVGMEAVKAAVDGLKGSIEVEDFAGKGTLVRLRLPLTLAIINALLFEVGTRLYAVPVPVVAEVAKIMTEDLVTIEGRKTLLLRDQVISIVSLEELFRIGGNGKTKKYVLVLDMGGRKIGLLIDRLMWQQELVIKAIDDRHLQTEFIAGGSILGSGQVVLILDVQAVIRKAIEAEKKKGLVAL